MEQQRPFFVPFPRPDLIGRDEALEQLHATLQRGDAAVTPALVGQGGIGKTQLAVRYAWDYGGHYPGGVFWLNCADPTPTNLLGQMAAYADQMGLAPRDLGGDADEVDRRLARIWVGSIRNRRNSLLVLDNLEEPSVLARELPGVPNARLPGLGCRLLATSRQRGLPGCTDVPVEWLGPEASRALLLREAGCMANGAHDEVAVETVCRLLGGLPLALRLAGALLRQYRVAFPAFADLLRRWGAVSVLSEKGVPLENYRDNLPLTMRALLAEHWDALPTDRRKLKSILLTLSCLPQARAVRVKLLCHLVEIPAETCPFGDPWEDALGELARVNLIERPEKGFVRLHPLIHDYAREQVDISLRADLVTGAAASLRRPEYLDSADAEELLALVRELPMLKVMADESRGPGRDLAWLWTCIEHEASHLRRGLDPLPQLHWRAQLVGDDDLAQAVAKALARKGKPWLRRKWSTARRDPAQRRVFHGHQGWVTACALSFDGRVALSGGHDRTVRLWNTESGECRLLGSHKGTSKNAPAAVMG